MINVIGHIYPPLNGEGKRKAITSVSKENLEKKILAYYKQKNQKNVIDTFEKLYPYFLDYKGKETSLANANKLDWVWNTYFKNDEIVKRKFEEITVAYLKN